MNGSLHRHLSRIGRKGGLKSRRELGSEAARAMVRVREARRAYRRFHTMCFWSRDPDYRVTVEDIPWLLEGLRRYGNRRAWEVAAHLCR